MKTLCVYCTRSGLTEKIAKEFAEKTGAEILYISDGKDRKGVIGYIGAAIAGLRGKLPPLLPYQTKLPIEEYDRIVVAFPIWCEDVCIIAKSFLAENREKFTGEIHYIATHMSSLDYVKKIKALDDLTGQKADSFLSVQTHKYDPSQEICDYAGKF